MAYKEITEDGNGNILEEKIIHTLDEYKNIVLLEMKEKWKSKFPSLEKQLNVLHGLANELESGQVKQLMIDLLKEYEENKAKINSSTTLEDVHAVLHGKGN